MGDVDGLDVVGKIEGVPVGLELVGERDGDIVGEADEGVAVGTGVGSDVGDADGAAVGAPVRAFVRWLQPPSTDSSMRSISSWEVM